MTKEEAVKQIERRNLIEFIDTLAITPSSKAALKIACEELVKENEKKRVDKSGKGCYN